MLCLDRRILSVAGQSDLQNMSPGNGVVVMPSGHDDTASLQAAINAVSAAGIAGTVYLTEGVYWVSMLEIPQTGKIAIRGVWSSATRIKRLPGVNTLSVIQTQGFDQLDSAGSYAQQGTGTNNGSNSVLLSGLTVDGNRSQNTGGHGVRNYGASPTLHDVTIEDCNGDLLTTAYNGEDVFADPRFTLEGRYYDLRLRRSGGTGWINKGPHDSVVSNVQIYNCDLDGWNNQAPMGCSALNTYGIGRRGVWNHGFGCINGYNLVGCGSETGALFESGGSELVACSFAGPVGLHIKGCNHNMFQGAICNTTIAALRLEGMYASGRFDLMYGGGNIGIWVDNLQDAGIIHPSEITIYSGDPRGSLFNPNQQPIPLGRVTVIARGTGKYGIFEHAPS